MKQEMKIHGVEQDETLADQNTIWLAEPLAMIGWEGYIVARG